MGHSTLSSMDCGLRMEPTGPRSAVRPVRWLSCPPVGQGPGSSCPPTSAERRHTRRRRGGQKAGMLAKGNAAQLNSVGQSRPHNL